MYGLIARELEATSVDRLLQIHEYERQRMGQDLHDSAGQLLVSLQLSIARLRRGEPTCDRDALIGEIGEIVAQIDQEIRALAFLNHPVELNGRGLWCAVQTLVRGFGRRTGIHTIFRIVGDQSALEEPVSTALLRVAQEALVNIHRHARATCARVVIERRPRHLQLTISDNGTGIELSTPDDIVRGIGVESMRHRVEALGGEFQITNLKRGTKVSATVPLAA